MITKLMIIIIISEFEETAEKALVAEKGWACTSGCRSSGVH